MNLKTNYSYIEPRQGDTYPEKLNDCIAQLGEITNKTIIKSTIFVEAYNNEEYAKIKNEIHSWLLLHYPGMAPKTSIIAQAPAGDIKLSIEVVTNVKQPIEHCTRNVEGYNYNVFSYKDFDIIVGCSCCGNLNDSLMQQSTDAFVVLKNILDKENLSFGNIIRQWNYIENLLANTEAEQNYQIFNNVRSTFYQTSDFPDGYPAATGIGQNAGGIIIDFIAVRTKKNGIVHPISNPAQINAYDYSDRVLEDSVTVQSKSPKFERAKLLIAGNEIKIFVSGTAAIKGEDSIEVMDAKEQTEVTIDNINQLINKSLIDKITDLKTNENSGRFSRLRVYVKNAEDLPVIMDICNQKFPDTTMSFVIADICRDNLYVEIEGEYVTSI